MAFATVVRTETLNSNNGAQVNGEPYYVGGQQCEIQTASPAALFGLQVSMDRQAWIAAEDADSGAITNVQTVYRAVRDRPLWVRGITANDGGGPRRYAWTLFIRKETD